MVRATSNGIRFIEPKYARLVQQLPEGPEWLYEVKFEGYRCLAGRDSSKVTLWSRRENVFTTQFPIIAQACEQLHQERYWTARLWLWMNKDGFPLTCGCIVSSGAQIPETPG